MLVPQLYHSGGVNVKIPPLEHAFTHNYIHIILVLDSKMKVFSAFVKINLAQSIY